MKGITYDKEHVKEVTCDSSKVDLNKEGKYELTYIIKGTINNQETSIKKTVEVKTISKTEAKEEAEKGNQVVTSNNEVKKDSKGNIPTGETSSNNSDNATSSGGSVEKPSGGNGNSGSSDNKPSGGGNGGSSDNKPSGGGDSKPEPKPEPDKHSHSYDIPITKVVHHEEVSHTVEHPAVTEDRGYYENQLVQDKQWVSNEVIVNICSGCGADITGNEYAHSKAHALAGESGGYYNEVVDKGYWTDPVYKQVWVQNIVTVKEAYSEKIVDQKAYDETVTVGYKCSCGATK